MVKATIEMKAESKVEKKDVECKFFVGVGISDVPELSHIPFLRGCTAECISMGGDVAVGDVVDTLAVSVIQIIEGLADDPEKKKFLKTKFMEKAGRTAFGVKDNSGVVVVGGR